MVTIYNTRINKEIKIDDKHHLVTLMPRDYDDMNPNMLIELKNINFLQHAQTCEDCKSFYSDLGTDTIDWFIKWEEKIYRLDLSNLGKGLNQTQVSRKISQNFTGSKLKLMISTETVDNLQNQLIKSLESENYEHCAFIRDRIIKYKS